ncbi:MAG: hypothetical protein KKC05_02195 [Nanoarchaeota archaeon]|nr:hypothetical protein [Nanoarchaeota archaeon]
MAEISKKQQRKLRKKMNEEMRQKELQKETNNKNTNRNIGILAVIIIVIAVVGVGMSVTGSHVVEPGQYDTFAQCLTEKGAVMYGAEWCSHCKAEKTNFGDSFQYVSYVECPDNMDVCRAAGVQGYPTWIINGQSYPGEQGLAGLASLTGCELPA